MDEKKKKVRIDLGDGESHTLFEDEDGVYRMKDNSDEVDDENEEHADNHKGTKLKGAMQYFPGFSIALLVYLLIGFITDVWHPTWIIFLVLPIINGIIDVVNGKGFFKAFPYPTLMVVLFLAAGFFFDWWHPAWLLFLTIPIYYALVYSKSISALITSLYPVFCAIAYLVLGFTLNLWHPGWLIFLTIPIFYGLVKMGKYSKENK